MPKRNFGNKIRITAYVEEGMYKALERITAPDEGEAWESRVTRKAFSEYLEKRGVDWKVQGRKKLPAAGRIVDNPSKAKDSLK